ncbi:hypothetical protein Bca4012_049552 [Brassica carinata]
MSIDVMDQVLPEVRLSTKELDFGGGGVSIGLISSMSIDVLICFKGRREVVTALLCWCALICWNNNVSWFARCLGLLRVTVLNAGDGFYIWKLKNGHVGRVFDINTESMGRGKWRREIHVTKSGILLQFGHVCRLSFLNWQERERFENQWVKFYRLQRRLEGGGSWRLEYVKEIQYIRVIWQSLHQSREFNVVYEMESGLVFSLDKV